MQTYDITYSHLLQPLAKYGVTHQNKVSKLAEYKESIANDPKGEVDNEQFLSFYELAKIRYLSPEVTSQDSDSSDTIDVFQQFLLERYRGTREFNRDDPLMFEAGLVIMGIRTNIFNLDCRTIRFDVDNLDLTNPKDLIIFQSIRKILFLIIIPVLNIPTLENKEASPEEVKEAIAKFQMYIAKPMIALYSKEGAEKIQPTKLSHLEMLMLQVALNKQFEIAWHLLTKN